MTDKEFLIMRIVSVGMVALIVILWTNNNALRRKVDACWWEIGVANSSISQADQALASAKDKAWSSYDTMGYALENLPQDYQQRPNPCDKSYSTDLNGYPSQ